MPRSPDRNNPDCLVTPPGPCDRSEQIIEHGDAERPFFFTAWRRNIQPRPAVENCKRVSEVEAMFVDVRPPFGLIPFEIRRRSW
jgi:hypothetical protein